MKIHLDCQIWEREEHKKYNGADLHHIKRGVSEVLLPMEISME